MDAFDLGQVAEERKRLGTRYFEFLRTPSISHRTVRPRGRRGGSAAAAHRGRGLPRRARARDDPRGGRGSTGQPWQRGIRGGRGAAPVSHRSRKSLRSWSSSRRPSTHVARLSEHHTLGPRVGTGDVTARSRPGQWVDRNGAARGHQVPCRGSGDGREFRWAAAAYLGGDQGFQALVRRHLPDDRTGRAADRRVLYLVLGVSLGMGDLVWAFIGAPLGIGVAFTALGGTYVWLGIGNGARPNGRSSSAPRPRRRSPRSR